jgi:hypothetical protein
MEAARTSETSVDNHFTRQYNPEDSSEHPGIIIGYITEHIFFLFHKISSYNTVGSYFRLVQSLYRAGVAQAV